MSTELDEALEWFDRAAQAREVAGQLTDPGARDAVLQLAESFDRLGQTALDLPPARKMASMTRVRTGTRDFSQPVAHYNTEPVISRNPLLTTTQNP